MVFFAATPDTSHLLIISNSIRFGKNAANRQSLSISANCLQMTVAVFGLAAVIANFAIAFAIVRWLVVFYLAWIGIKLFLSKKSASNAKHSSSGELLRKYQQGIFTPMTNPFAAPIFAALFPQYIDTNIADIPQLTILGVTHILVDGTILSVLSLAGIQASKRTEIARLSIVNSICGGLHGKRF